MDNATRQFILRMNKAFEKLGRAIDKQNDTAITHDDKLYQKIILALDTITLEKQIRILDSLNIEHGQKYLENLKTNKGIEPNMLNTLIEYYNLNLERRQISRRLEQQAKRHLLEEDNQEKTTSDEPHHLPGSVSAP